ESVVLTASSGASWQWYRDDSPIGGATSQNYHASIAGEYMVSVTGANGCSAYSSPRTITEATPTTPAISHTDSTSFCDGGSVQLVSSSAPSYQWLRNDIAIPGATFQTYVATTSGSYSVATLDGCAAASAPVVVTVHPLPDAQITAPTSIVADSSANASVPAQSGASYAWSIINGTILSSPAGSSISFRAGIVGEVSLSVTVTREGCTSNSTHQVSITATADLGLKKSGPASVSAGEMIAFKLIVSNSGPNVAANVVLQDQLPPGTSFVSAAGTMSCIHSNGLVTCSTPQIASGASASVDLFVTSPLVATLVSNTASVASAGNDPAPGDNSSTAEVSVIGTPGGCALVPPALLSPAAGAISASPVAFSWTPVTGAVAYEVWVISGGTLTLAGSTSSTSLQAELSSGASSWFVVARLGTGCDPLTTSERPFTVSQREFCPIGALPQIINPPAGSQLSSPVLIMWTPASEAIGYRVWMSVNGAAPEDVGATGGATSLIAHLPPGTITLYVDAIFGGCPPARSGGVVVNIPGEDRCGNRGFATPMTPANDTILSTSAASFAWSPAPNADGYRVWASIDNGIPLVVGSTNEGSAEAILPAGEIFWWIESLYDGCMSTESQQLRLVIPPATSCGTALPQPLFPSAGASVATADVTFSWSSVADALAYEVWLAMENGVPVLIGTTSSTSLTRHVPGGVFEWFVRALPDRCPARDSSTRRFTRTLPAECDALARPSTLAPGDGDQFVASVTFKWLPAEGASSYEIFVIRTGAPALVLSTTATTIEGVPLPVAKYRWYVRAHAGGSCWLDSEEQHFEVTTAPGPCGILPAPMIATPAEISSKVPFPIQWTAVAGALGYQLQIASNALFQGAELITTSATHHEVVKVNDSGAPIVIYARVRAVDTRCTPPITSPYSPTAAIFILPPQLPGGAAPSTGGIVTYTIELGPELAGQSFVAIPDKPFLTVSPASGVVAAGGTTLTVIADTNALPLGMTLGGVVVTLNSSSAGRAVSHATTSLSSLFSINLVTPISPTTKNTPPPDALIIPAVAHADGIDSHFQSDVRVSNTSPQLMKYQLTFTASGDTGITQGRQTTFSIEPGQTIALDNILKTWFGTANTNTTGSLEIRPLTPVARSLSSATVGSVADLLTFASSKTFNLTSDGTFGQFIPAVPYANFIGKAAAGAGSRVLSLQQIAQSAKYRTNLGLVEASGDPASLLVRVFGSNGQQLSEFPVNLKGGQHAQLNSFITAQGLGTVSDGRVEVEVISSTGKVTAYASVLDNETSDPLLVTPVLLTDNGSTRWVVPGVADIDTGAANWQTDMRVFNPGDTAVDTTFSFYSQTGEPARTASITIPPGEVRQLDRIVSSLFGASQDGGAIHVDTLQPERLIATARTYNQTSGGTYGQFISAVTPADAIAAGSRPLQLLQIEESDRYRTNIGLAEVLGQPAVIEVSVIPPDTKFSAVVTIAMGPNEFRQIGSLLRSVGLENTHNARVTVRVIGGAGRVTAYASVVDMETNDPTYIPAQ
ncbi:MAG TPA: DUF11 domain-containing protein, partial [Thermoanaerobaculia bacterium]